MRAETRLPGSALRVGDVFAGDGLFDLLEGACVTALEPYTHPTLPDAPAWIARLAGGRYAVPSITLFHGDYFTVLR